MPLPCVGQSSGREEEERLAELAGYDILDTPAESGFDDVVLLATQLCQTSVALVSLVDRERQWFKARVGFSLAETPLSQSVCAHALRAADILVIPDLTRDDRTRDNALVTGEPFIRFYAGAALETPNGRRLGTLCVIDGKPRPEGLTADQASGLRSLARQTMAQLELRRALVQRDRALADRDMAEADLRRDAGRHIVLLSIQQAISAAAGNFDAILDIAVNGALRMIAAADGAAVEMREDAELVYRAAAGSLAAHVGRRLWVAGSLSGLSMLECRPLHTGDALTDPRVNTTLARELGLRSVIVAPIIRLGEFVGVLKLQSVVADAFAEPDVLTVQLLAGAVAAGLSDVAEAQSIRDLRAQEELLRLAQEAGQIGTFDTDVERGVTRGSDQFWRLFGLVPRAEAPTSLFADLVLPEDRKQITTDARRRAGLDATSVDYRIRRADTGEVRWIARSANYIKGRDGRFLRLIGTARDITLRKRAELRQAALVTLGDRIRDLEETAAIAFVAAEILGETLGASRAGYGSVDLDNKVSEVERDWTAPGFATSVGRHAPGNYGLSFDALMRGEAEAIGDTRSDPRTAAHVDAFRQHDIAALLRVPLLEHGRLVALFFLHDHVARDWPAEDIDFVRNVADRTRAAVERVRADERRKVLNDELNHRLKNTIAMVQAIAMQTLRGASSVAEARDALTSRLMALSHAHDILVDGRAERARLVAVINGAIKVHGDGAPGRFRIEGPDLEIGPKATLSLTLMLHELATNAVKYGALSTQAGAVAITWSVDEAAEFQLVWRETGGPTVEPPRRKGFGSRLIERGVAGAVDGRIALAYEPAGVVCTLDAPMSGVRAA